MKQIKKETPPSTCKIPKELIEIKNKVLTINDSKYQYEVYWNGDILKSIPGLCPLEICRIGSNLSEPIDNTFDLSTLALGCKAYIQTLNGEFYIGK